MKTIDEVGFQGDLLFIRVEELPKGLTAAPESNSYIVGHSETQHHHVLEAPKAKFYPVDPMTAFMTLALEGDMVHKRSFDTHETLRLKPGIWKVKRQREWTPEGLRRVED